MGIGREPADSAESHDPVRFLLAKRALMAAATAFLAINLCTGAPLFALWVGSRVVGQRTITMAAVFVVVAVMLVLMLAMALAIMWLSATYNRVTGHPLRESRLTWLRPMNTRRDTVDYGISANLLEQIVMATVIIAVVAIFVWFFAFAGSPLPAL